MNFKSPSGLKNISKYLIEAFNRLSPIDALTWRTFTGSLCPVSALTWQRKACTLSPRDTYVRAQHMSVIN